MKIRQFTFACGFAMAFGALFAKTWRVHMVMIASMKTAKSKVSALPNTYLIRSNLDNFILKQL